MKIPLTKDNTTVAEVSFTGKTALTSKGTIRAVGGHTETASNIRNLVRTSGGMSRADTSSPDGLVKYWTGFWGWLSALNVVLPSLGVSVDWANVEYP